MVHPLPAAAAALLLAGTRLRFAIARVGVGGRKKQMPRARVMSNRGNGEKVAGRAVVGCRRSRTPDTTCKLEE